MTFLSFMWIVLNHKYKCWSIAEWLISFPSWYFKRIQVKLHKWNDSSQWQNVFTGKCVARCGQAKYRCVDEWSETDWWHFNAYSEVHCQTSYRQKMCCRTTHAEPFVDIILHSLSQLTLCKVSLDYLSV